MDRLGGWNTETMAEDAEFAAQWPRQGSGVWWVPDALTYDEEPRDLPAIPGPAPPVVQRRHVRGRPLSAPAVAAGPSRNFFYCLDFAVFLSMPMVQVLALLPGLWAVAQAVLLENWLALALSLASFWGGMTLTALALALAGRQSCGPVEVHFALSIVHCFLVSPTYSGCFPEDQGLEAHCPPWSDGPAAGELGAVSDRGWGERRAYYDHGERLRRAREEAGLSQRQVCGDQIT